MADVNTTGLTSLDSYINTFTNPNPTSTAKGNPDLGKDAFLTILIAQLQNQDPTNPMDNTQMVSQLAQFSQLEQMQQLNQNYEQTNAYNMVGKFVSAQMRDVNGLPTQDMILGFVDSVFSNNGEFYVSIGGYNLKLSDVKAVYDANAIEGKPGDLSQAAGMIGKYVKCEEQSEDENGVPVTIYYEGTVKRVVSRDGLITLVIERVDKDGNVVLDKNGDPDETETSFAYVTEVHDRRPEAEPDDTGDTDPETTP